MPRYNTTFELDLQDMNLIETALLKVQRDAARDASGIDSRAVAEVLGKLHNQKVFYRPQRDVYVSG